MAKITQKMLVDLSGRRALVAGSSQGIGFAIAQQFSESGAEVCLIARNEESLKKALAHLPTPNQQSHSYIVADFSKPEEVKNALMSYLNSHNGFDILVNNTGGPRPGPANMADIEEFYAAFNQHLACNHLLSQELIPNMKKNGFGRIINIISTSVKQPLPNLGVSNTIRGAVANWSKTLATELGPHGITVNNLLPGATSTQRLDGIIKNKSTKTGQSEDETTGEMLKEIPAGRFGKPEELAYTACFVASNLAGYINGINIPVDGGRTGCL